MRRPVAACVMGASGRSTRAGALLRLRLHRGVESGMPRATAFPAADAVVSSTREPEYRPIYPRMLPLRPVAGPSREPGVLTQES